MRIKDLPKTCAERNRSIERPILPCNSCRHGGMVQGEKLEKYGPEKLSNSELLA